MDGEEIAEEEKNTSANIFLETVVTTFFVIVFLFFLIKFLFF